MLGCPLLFASLVKCFLTVSSIVDQMNVFGAYTVILNVVSEIGKNLPVV
jgi:hypothetical protein